MKTRPPTPAEVSMCYVSLKARAPSTPYTISGMFVQNTEVSFMLTSYCLRLRKSDVDVQFQSTCQQNCAEGSKICIRFLFSCLPLSLDIFSRCHLYNSPRFFNSPQLPHPFSVIIHNTIDYNTPNSCLVRRNTKFPVVLITAKRQSKAQ